MVTVNSRVRARAPTPPMILDYGFLRRASFIMGLLLLLISPFSLDPLALAMGGFIPWLPISIVAKPTIEEASRTTKAMTLRRR